MGADGRIGAGAGHGLGAGASDEHGLGAWHGLCGEHGLGTGHGLGAGADMGKGADIGCSAGAGNGAGMSDNVGASGGDRAGAESGIGARAGVREGAGASDEHGLGARHGLGAGTMAGGEDDSSACANSGAGSGVNAGAGHSADSGANSSANLGADSGADSSANSGAGCAANSCARIGGGTEVIRIDPERIDSRLIERAAQYLRGGELVAFPTETVYGLGASAFDERAVRSVYAAKGRPSDNPLILHIWDAAQLDGIAQCVEPVANALMERFWPGPLTIIFRKRADLPRFATAGLDTVAVRMPSHPVARALLRAAGVPVAAPSANLSGKPSPTLAEHVARDLGGRIAAIIDADGADGAARRGCSAYGARGAGGSGESGIGNGGKSGRNGGGNRSAGGVGGKNGDYGDRNRSAGDSSTGNGGKSAEGRAAASGGGGVAGRAAAGGGAIGLESTVVDVSSGNAVILRPGGVTPEEIEAVVGAGRVFLSYAADGGAAEMPKMPAAPATSGPPSTGGAPAARGAHIMGGAASASGTPEAGGAHGRHGAGQGGQGSVCGGQSGGQGGQGGELGGGPAPKSPGVKYRHYAPDAEMILLKGPRAAVAYWMRRIAERPLGGSAACGSPAAVGNLATVSSPAAGGNPVGAAIAGGARIASSGAHSPATDIAYGSATCAAHGSAAGSAHSSAAGAVCNVGAGDGYSLAAGGTPLRGACAADYGILASDELLDMIPKRENSAMISLGGAGEPQIAASRLFGALREFDAMGVRAILCEHPPEAGLGLAIADRMKKAASGRVADLGRISRVLFVCTGNTCRSCMAEAIFNAFAPGARAASAGIAALNGSPVSREAAEALAAGWGISLSGHRARMLEPWMLDESDLVLTMSRGHRESILARRPDLFFKVFTLLEGGGDIPDPFGLGIGEYCGCAARIGAALAALPETLAARRRGFGGQ